MANLTTILVVIATVLGVMHHINGECVNKIGDHLCAASGEEQCVKADFRSNCQKFCGLTNCGVSDTSSTGGQNQQSMDIVEAVDVQGDCKNDMGDHMCARSGLASCQNADFRKGCQKFCGLTNCGVSDTSSTGGQNQQSMDIVEVVDVDGDCSNNAMGNSMCAVSGLQFCQNPDFRKGCQKFCCGTARPNGGHAQDIVDASDLLGPCEDHPSMNGQCQELSSDYCFTHREFALSCPETCGLCEDEGP